MTVVTLTSDFGTADGYVGTMKGVILSIAPQAQLVDLSHQVPPQDVHRAAYLLAAAAPFFPPDTVHLAVVDPGVGTRRRAIALRTPLGTFVGPDNGLFSYVLAETSEWSAVELTEPAYRLAHMSDTFHGRDVFAPAAAHLARGVALEKLGPPLRGPLTLSLPGLAVDPRSVTGAVLYADRFGNLVTSIGRLAWEGARLRLRPAFRREPTSLTIPVAARVELGGQTIHRIHHTYGEVNEGDLLALVGSDGFLEVAVRQGDAAARLAVGTGEAVVLRW